MVRLAELEKQDAANSVQKISPEKWLKKMVE
jgi:hypothetical protein